MLVSAGPHQFAFLRYEDRLVLFVINDRGTVLSAVNLDKILPDAHDTISNFLWQSGTRFLIFVEHRVGRLTGWSTEAVQVEAKTGAITKVSGFRSPPVLSVDIFPDGGFVTVVSHATYEATRIEVHAYDGQERQRWMLKSMLDTEDGPASIRMPDSVAVLRNGLVAVLDESRSVVQLYDPQGGYRRTLLLDEARERTILARNILADPRGGFLVENWQGLPPLIWFDSQGKVVRSFVPLYEDGTEIECSDVAMGADGSVWVSDFHAILSLNAQGRIVKRLGAAKHTH